MAKGETRPARDRSRAGLSSARRSLGHDFFNRRGRCFIRPGWFYHEEQDPKSLEELVEIYFHSVGRGTPLLLNIPPNQDGLFDDKISNASTNLRPIAMSSIKKI